VNTHRVPSGPQEPYPPGRDLIAWLSEHFDRYGDIFKASIYGASVYVVSAPDGVEHVLLKNWRNYVKGRAIKRIALLLGKGLMVSEGDFWISQRRMIQPAFLRASVGDLTGMITDCNKALLAEWETAARAGRSVNVTRDVSRMTLEIVLRAIFGDDFDQCATEFQILSERPERSLEFAEAFRPLAEVVERVASRRRKATRAAADILGVLLQARERDTGEPMSDRQLCREVMTLVVAGHETTASVLNWTWYLLSQHPAIERKLESELGLPPVMTDPAPLDELPRYRQTRAVIDEAMRLYPPGWLMTRKALSDDRVAGYFVPAGTEIFIAPYLIQRHPGLWSQPHVFNPDRFLDETANGRHALAMIPFSAGPRNCIGEFLARVEMQLHLMTVVPKLRLRYASGQPPEMIAGVNLLSRNDFIMAPESKRPQ
jgi:cytochrome P450